MFILRFVLLQTIDSHRTIISFFINFKNIKTMKLFSNRRKPDPNKVKDERQKSKKIEREVKKQPPKTQNNG